MLARCDTSDSISPLRSAPPPLRATYCSPPIPWHPRLFGRSMDPRSYNFIDGMAHLLLLKDMQHDKTSPVSGGAATPVTTSPSLFQHLTMAGGKRQFAVSRDYTNNMMVCEDHEDVFTGQRPLCLNNGVWCDENGSALRRKKLRSCSMKEEDKEWKKSDRNLPMSEFRKCQSQPQPLTLLNFDITSRDIHPNQRDCSPF